MDSLAKVFSRMQTKYMTLECFFVLMSLYWTSSAFEFLISCLLPNKIDFVLSSPKWILNLLSTNQSQSMVKFLFNTVLISGICFCWNIKQVSSAYSNSSQTTACGRSFIWNKKVSRRFPDLEKVYLISTLNFLFDR